MISRWTPTASGDVKLRQRRPVASFRYVETIVTEMLQWPYINVDPIGGTAMATRSLLISKILLFRVLFIFKFCNICNC
nr:hypothetical protein Iba_chr11eCG9290 [Ipomoea batatas]